jgi:hypothetical protein
MTPFAALEKTVALLRSSEASAWAPEDPLEIVARLEAAIAALQRGARLDRADLAFLFLPTGPIQEISIHNGWGGEFVALAAAVDALIEGQ